jgi:nucleotide-binding universal stress UspA family protein
LRQDTEERGDTIEQEFGSTPESSNNRHIRIGFPSFERILVAYDGSEISKRALSYASYVSKVSDSETFIVNIVEPDRDLNKVLPLTIKANLDGKEEQIGMEPNPPKALQDELLLKVVEDMAAACKAAGLTKNITYEIRAGNPADEIIDISNLIRFDLIVMGSRRIASVIGGIGSTTRKVISTVKTPLLIVQKQQRYKDEW